MSPIKTYGKIPLQTGPCLPSEECEECGLDPEELENEIKAELLEEYRNDVMELFKKIEKLETENKLLKEENSVLKKENMKMKDVKEKEMEEEKEKELKEKQVKEKKKII